MRGPFFDWGRKAMADVRRVVQQWLETDEALGVFDVPLVRRAAAPSASPASAAPPPAALMRAAPPPARPAVPAAPRPAPAARSPVPAREDPMAKRKAAPVVALPPAPEGNIADLLPMTREAKEAALAELLAKVEADSHCLLNDISTRLVFGEGDPDAKIMFVGEGPGIEEDKTGRPFVGRSGQLLDKMIAAMGFNREELPQGKGGVYIANVVKLRCAEFDDATGRLKDRPPTPEEAARGLPILHRQIEIVRPLVIVTLGAPAVKWLTGTTEGVTKIRGTWLNYRGIPVMPTYHPSFLLRAYTQENRAKVWSDLQAALKKIDKK
jgi:DNA polymerase